MYTPEQFELSNAASSGNRPKVEALLAAGVDPSFSVSGGVTPLHLAVDGEIDWSQDNPVVPDVPIALLLLEAGALPNPRDEDGRTPLDWADGGSPWGPVHPTAYKALLRFGGKKGVDVHGAPEAPEGDWAWP